MADTHKLIDTETLVLIDNWPASPDWPGTPDRETLASAVSHNVAAGLYKVGTKFRSYYAGKAGSNGGWSTLIYLQASATAEDNTAMAVLSLCAPALVVQDADAAGKLYLVDNDATAGTGYPSGLCAVAIGTMNNSRFGWFWCGGPPPINLVAGLEGDVYTTGSVVLGQAMLADSGDDANTLGLTVQTAGFPAVALINIATDDA